MNLTARVLVLVLAIAPSILYAGDWIKVTSLNFVLYTSTREYEARIVLTSFERARDFFLRVHPTKLDSREPVVIVSFDAGRDYRPFSPKAFTPAYNPQRPAAAFNTHRKTTIPIAPLCVGRNHLLRPRRIG